MKQINWEMSGRVDNIFFNNFVFWDPLEGITGGKPHTIHFFSAKK